MYKQTETSMRRVRYGAGAMNEADVEECLMDGSRINTKEDIGIFHGSRFEMPEIDKLRRIVVLSRLVTATLSQFLKISIKSEKRVMTAYKNITMFEERLRCRNESLMEYALLVAFGEKMTKALNNFWTNIAMMNIKYLLGFFQYYHKFHTSFCYTVAVYVQVFLSTNLTSFGSKCRKRAESVRVNRFVKSFCHIALLTFIIKNRVMFCSTSLLVKMDVVLEVIIRILI